MNMRTSALISLSCALAVFCGCGKKEPAPATPAPAGQKKPAPVFNIGNDETRNTVLVTVNGKKFTRGMAIDMVKMQAIQQGVPPEEIDQYLAQGSDELMRRCTDQFVNITLIQEEVERRADPVSEAEIQTFMTRIASDLPEGVNITNALAARGMTMEKLREQIVAGERVRKLFEAETSVSNTVTEADVESFYKLNSDKFKSGESVEARHVLISCAPDAADDAKAVAKATAESVRTQLVAGADFAVVAAAKSSCGSKDKGGSLGVFGRGQMVPPFEKAAFSQEVDAIGPVVETEFGYHVIQVTKKMPGTVIPLKDVAPSIRKLMEQQAREKRTDALLKTLRGKAKIEYPEPAKAPVQM